MTAKAARPLSLLGTYYALHKSCTGSAMEVTSLVYVETPSATLHSMAAETARTLSLLGVYIQTDRSCQWVLLCNGADSLLIFLCSLLKSTLSCWAFSACVHRVLECELRDLGEFCILVQANSKLGCLAG